jgi:ubiquinone biosynthesis protein
MEVQPQLVLLQKTLLNIEGLGRQLYPDLDLWQTAKPFLEDWMKERMGPKGVYRTIKQQAPDWLEKMPHMPQLIFDALNQVRNLDDARQRDIRAYEQAKADLQTKNNRTRYLGLALIASALVFSDDRILEWLCDLPAGSWVLAGLGVLFLLKRS